MSNLKTNDLRQAICAMLSFRSKASFSPILFQANLTSIFVKDFIEPISLEKVRNSSIP